MNVLTLEEMKTKWMKENEIKKLPEYKEEIFNTNGGMMIGGLNKKCYIASINKKGSRLHEKRQEKKCNCCNENFKPMSYTVLGAYKLTEYCEKCSGNIHAKKRELIKKYGIEIYNEIIKLRKFYKTTSKEYKTELYKLIGRSNTD